MTDTRDIPTHPLRAYIANPQRGILRLIVVHGPDQGTSFSLPSGTSLIGTSIGCDIRLTDPTVSRRHASVEVLAEGVRITDLRSKNGTHYQGARFTQMELGAGTTFDLGSTRLSVQTMDEASDASAQAERIGLVGRAPKMRKLFFAIERAARSDAPVMIEGETGTGKEHVARALHNLSSRSAGPFRIFDCAAAQGDLLPSALFGHRRGAFTGAIRDTAGALEEADGGTLFLDEIAELPLEHQTTLLRAIETGIFKRVGDSEEHSSDFRVVCATHQNIEQAVERGRFRRDLYYRLAVIRLEVPALRERPEDIPLLVEHFAKQLAAPGFRCSPGTLAAFSVAPWPGNVRELRNAVERAVTLGTESSHQFEIGDAAAPDEGFHQARERVLESFEKSYLEQLLRHHRGSVTAAARAAKVARSYLYTLLEQRGLKPKKNEDPLS